MNVLYKIAAQALFDVWHAFGLEKVAISADHPALRLAQRGLVPFHVADEFQQMVDEMFRQKYQKHMVPYHLPGRFQKQTRGFFQFRPSETEPQSGRYIRDTNGLRTFLPHPPDPGFHGPSGTSVESTIKIPEIPTDLKLLEELKQGRLSKAQIYERLGLVPPEPAPGTKPALEGPRGSSPRVFRRRG